MASSVTQGTASGDLVHVRVLSYNLNLLPALVIGTGHRHKSQRLKEFLKALPLYDIVVLQEVFSTPWFGGWGCRQTELIREALVHGFYFSRGRIPTWCDLLRRKTYTDSGLLIFSKYPILHRGSLLFKERGSHLDRGATKGVVYAHIEIGKASLLVFNTHLQATHSNSQSYEDIRARQLTELKKFIANTRHQLGRNIPWILTGDFNIDAISSPAVADEYGYVYDNQNIESVEYKTMIDTIDPTNTLRDLLKEDNGGQHPPTRPPRMEFPRSVSHIFKHKYPQRLDYIFFHPGEHGGGDGDGPIAVLPESTVVVPFAVHGREFFHISDHYGVRTTVLYRGCDEDESLMLSTNQAFDHLFSDEHATRSGWNATHPLLKVQMVLAAALLLGLVAWHNRAVLLLQVAMFLVLYVTLRGGWRAVQALKGWRRRRVAWRLRTRASGRAVKGVLGTYVEGHGPAHRSPVQPHVLAHSTAEQDEVATLHDSFQRALTIAGPRACLGTRERLGGGTVGPYRWITYEEVGRRVQHFGSGLVLLGLGVGQRVGIFCAGNREEWMVCDLACHAYSLVSVPLHDGDEGFLEHAIRHAGLRVVVCSREATRRILALSTRCPSLERIVQMDPLQFSESYSAEAQAIKLTPFRFIEQRGAQEPQPFRAPSPDVPATLVYEVTPSHGIKATMLTHGNLVAQAAGIAYQGKRRLRLTPEDVHLSYTPPGHVLERSVLALVLGAGGAVGFAQGDRHKLYDDLRALRPTVWFGVPGVFVRLHRKWKIIRSSWWRPTRWLYARLYQAQVAALRRGHARPCYRDAFFRRFARRLGGRLRLVCVTSDGLLPRVHQEFLHITLCCAVTQCYVRTETGVVACSTMSGWAAPGQHAGYPVGCNEVRLVDVPSLGFTSRTRPEQGQIAVRGANVFSGYHDAPSLNATRRTTDGWFLTEDIGQWNPDGSLTILGHRSGILQPVKGILTFDKYIECILLESFFVQQIFVTCKRFRPLVAVVVPDPEVLFWWAKREGVHHDFRVDTLCTLPQAVEAVAADLAAVADEHGLHPWEYVQAVHLEPHQFGVHNGLVTPTLDLCRPALGRHYAAQVREMYVALGHQVQTTLHRRRGRRQMLSRSARAPRLHPPGARPMPNTPTMGSRAKGLSSSSSTATQSSPSSTPSTTTTASSATTASSLLATTSSLLATTSSLLSPRGSRDPAQRPITPPSPLG